MRVVIVSHVFAPSTHQNAKRPYLMAKYLVSRGWAVTVLTSSFERDEAAKGIREKDGIQVEYFNPFPLPLLNGVMRLPFIFKKMHLFFNGLIFPDYFAFWARQVAARLKTLEYNCAILNVRPFSAFLLQELGVLDSRWAIDYQEVIYPYLERKPRSSPFQRKQTSRLLSLERAALQVCGSVWFTSKPAMELYIAEGAVEESKVALIPGFYDPDMYVREINPPSGLLSIVYGGDLSHSYRPPDPFFRAWSDLRHKWPEAFSAIRLIVYGQVAEGCRQQAIDLRLWDKIDVKRKIPYPDFLHEASKADALLCIDATEQQYFIPGKLADYFGTSRPVLTFTSKGSGVQDQMESVGMGRYVSDPSDKAACLGNLVRLWSDWRGASEWPDFSTDMYSAASVCNDVNHWLQVLAEKTILKPT